MPKLEFCDKCQRAAKGERVFEYNFTKRCCKARWRDQSGEVFLQVALDVVENNDGKSARALAFEDVLSYRAIKSVKNEES